MYGLLVYQKMWRVVTQQTCSGWRPKLVGGKLKELTEQQPRPVLIRFQDFADKQRVLDAIRRSSTVRYQESSIMYFQDLSATVLRK